MADRVWKGVYPQVFGHSKQLSKYKFFDPSTPSMRKGRDGGEKRENYRGKKKILMEIVATTSLPAVDRLNANCWNPACLRQNQKNQNKIKNQKIKKSKNQKNQRKSKIKKSKNLKNQKINISTYQTSKNQKKKCRKAE